MKRRIFVIAILCISFVFACPALAKAPQNEIVGDVDLNRTVNSDDAILLLQNILFPNLYPTSYNGSVDFNCDGRVNADDAVRLLQHAMFPAFYPLTVPASRMDLAVYLIDDTGFTKERYDGHGYELIHGWTVDDRGSVGVNKYADYNGAFSDYSFDSSVSMYKYITPVSSGKLTFEASIFLKQADDGFEIRFLEDDKNVLKLITKDGRFGLYGKEQVLSDVSAEGGQTKIKIDFDLDEGTAVLYIGPSFVCEAEMCAFESINKVSIGTTDTGKLMFSPDRVALYMNYAANDTFMLYGENEIPSGYETDGDVKTAEFFSGSYDGISVRMNGKSRTTRSFSRLSGGFVTEFYVLQSDMSQMCEFSVGDVKLKMQNGGYYIDGQKVSSYHENVWQCIRFERNQNSKEVVVRICGKDVYSFESDEGISEFTIENYGGTLYFDDVKCYNTYEFSDYVPVPENVQKKTDITVCMSVCSLWHEGSHYGWDYVSPYDELIPVFGFYDEGLAETADWEIKYLVESGIDAIQPCWYASTTTNPIKEPRLNKYAIHDGYFNAKYKDMLDICIMWENQGVKSGMSLERFKKYLWNYWIDWYFLDPGYMCFDNKPVLTIYQYDAFVNCFGSAEEARKVIEFMREDIKNYGFDGLILLFSTYSAIQSNNIDKTALEDGIEFDGLLPYHWGIDAYDPEYIKGQHEAGYTGKGDNVIVATASTGRNIIGWEQTRSPIATYEQHLEALTYLTEELLPVYEEDFGEGSWQSRLLFLGTWNEYAEGHWLAPTGTNGKGPGADYMNVWKEVFVENPVETVIPTKAQKERIAYLYPAVTTPIRAELIETKPKNEIATSTLVSSFGFYDSDFSDLSFTRFDEAKISDGILYGKAESESTKSDPSFVVKSTFSGIDSKDVDLIHIRMKANIASTVNVYPKLDGDTAYSPNKMMTSRYTDVGEWQDIYIETSDYVFWDGSINNLRFDLINNYGSFECDIIELLSYAEALAVNVDGIKLDINAQYITEKNGELYIAALPAEGVYSALGITYEWHRFDGRLILKAGSGDRETDFVFEVGSDTCLVNGEEKSLAEEFYLFDTIPVIPMLFLLGEAGFEYEYTSCERLYVNARSGEYSDEASPFEFGFDVPGDYCGFGLTRVNGFVYDGALYLFPERQANGSFDPIISNGSIRSFLAENCESITVRMKYTLYGKSDDYATLYFNTSSDISYSENRAVKVKLSSVSKDADGYGIYTFDLNENEYFKGGISAIRFDAANSDGEFIIDYIKINMKE